MNGRDVFVRHVVAVLKRAALDSVVKGVISMSELGS